MIDVGQIVRAQPVLDELSDEDGALVLVETGGVHRVVRLSALGQLIRDLAKSGISVGKLASELEAILGPAEDGESGRLVAQAVTALVADGVLSVGDS